MYYILYKYANFIEQLKLITYTYIDFLPAIFDCVNNVIF